MDFTFDETQLDLADLTRDIVAGTVTADHHARLDRSIPRLDTDLVAALVDADITTASLPSEHGGSHLGLLHDCAVAIELGRGLAAVPFTTSVVACGAVVLRYGGDEAIRTLGVDAAHGRCVLAPATAEDLAGPYDRPRVRATSTPYGWSVTGTKVAVPYGAVADAFLVSVEADDGDGDGDRMVVVFARDPGVTVIPVAATGADCSAVVRFDGAVVPATAVLQPPTGVDAVAVVRERSIVMACAVQLGVLQAALDLVSEYAAQRIQFGRPIGSFQAVGQRLADAYIDVSAVRSALWRAAWTLENTPDTDPRHEVTSALATAKFWAADAGHRVAHTLVHVHGGVGIDTSHIAHRYFLAAKNGEFLLGNATESLLHLGRELVAAETLSQ